LTETLGAGGTTYGYDHNGNTVSKAGPGGSVGYTWDQENRLVGADTDGDGTTDVTNAYDADGIRVSQTAGGEETRYLIDTVQAYPQVALEYRPGGLVVVSYVHGNDLISQKQDGVKSIYHVDGLGSTRALSDAAGVVTDRYMYEAFGRTIGQTGATPNSYLFAGEQRDGLTGLDYLRARYLDVGMGRFFSRDVYEGQLSKPLSVHRYVYAHANPTFFTDPSGYFSLASVSVAMHIRVEIAEAFSIAGLQAVTRTARVAGLILEPAAMLQEVGLSLIAADKPRGFEIYAVGRQLSALGFQATSDILFEIYSDTLDKLRTDEFDFDDFDDDIDDLIDEVHDFIDRHDLRQYVRDGRGGQELAEGVERIVERGQDIIDRIG